MIYYEISSSNPLSSYLQVKTRIAITDPGATLQLQLAAWRPGRYELQNFAQKIQQFRVVDAQNNPVPYQKLTKDRWEIQPQSAGEITIYYNFYARQMDAGGSWTEELFLYINPINLIMAVAGQEQEACELKLNIPDDWQIACGLPVKAGNTLVAENYEHLVDSPLIASPSLKLASYEVKGIPFYIWLQGDCQPDWPRIVSNFTAFTLEQVNLFGDFPVADYHFLNLLLPYKHYHGVEHGNSTVITLGPAELLMTKSLYKEFIGVSSHELFHTWNIKKIRPAEMMPYDYTQENYFRTGFIAEGLTTYYGDYMLARAGVFTAEEYFDELNGVLSKHFSDYGNEHYSLADSSFDLWLDGYKSGVPDRKVSIYHKGALAALILDLEIRRNTNHISTLDSVMKRLYTDFGQKGIGYTEENYQNLVADVGKASFAEYFTDLIYGTAPLQPYLEKALNYVGCTLVTEQNPGITESTWGFKTALTQDTNVQVTAIAPGSPAYTGLSLQDEIIAINGRKVEGNIANLIGNQSEIHLTLFRNKQICQVTLAATCTKYFPKYKVQKQPEALLPNRANFFLWLKQAF